MGLHNFLIFIKNRNFGPKWKILIRHFWSKLCFNRKVRYFIQEKIEIFPKTSKFLARNQNFCQQIEIWYKIENFYQRFLF